jgi:anti-anti-sigma factor
MRKPSAPCIVTKVDDGYNFKLISGASADQETIEKELDQIVAAKPKKVYVDLAACDMIGSTGMGMLLHFQSRLRANGGSMKIVAIQKFVYNSFRIGRLDQLFGISPEVIIAK